MLRGFFGIYLELRFVGGGIAIHVETRPIRTEIEHQNFAFFLRRERKRALASHTCAVSFQEYQIVERDLSRYNVDPRASTFRELVNHVPPGVKDRGIDKGVLLNQERAFSSVRRGYNAKQASSLGDGETLLFEVGLESIVGGVQAKSKEMRPIGIGRVLLTVANDVIHGETLKFSRAHCDGATSFASEQDLSFLRVRHDLVVKVFALGPFASRGDSVLGEHGKRRKPVREGVIASRLVGRVERMPYVVITKGFPAPLARPSDRDHLELNFAIHSSTCFSASSFKMP